MSVAAASSAAQIASKNRRRPEIVSFGCFWEKREVKAAEHYAHRQWQPGKLPERAWWQLVGNLVRLRRG